MAPIASFDTARWMGVLLVAFLGGGTGVSLGGPPQEPDPMMARIAPSECLYYSTWVGTARPDAESPNQTEQLMSEPEVIAFAKEVERALTVATQEMSVNAGVVTSKPQAILLENAPMLIKTLVTHPVTFFVESVDRAERGVRVKGALVVNLGDAADKVTGVVTQLLDAMPVGLTKKVTIEGVECLQLRLDPSTPVFTVGRKNTYLIVAAGEGSFEGVLTRAATAPPKWLIDGVKTLEVPRLASLSYADVGAITRLAGQFSGPEVGKILDLLGVRSLTTAISITGLDATGFVSRTKIASSDQHQGLDAALTGKPLEAKDLAGIPADATIAVALRLDAQQVLREGLQLLDKLEPRAAAEIRQAMNEMEQQVGIDIETELLGSLGDVWTLHTAPRSGGLLAGWTLTVNLRDAKQADAWQQKYVQFFAGFGGQFGLSPLREFEYRKQTAYQLVLPNGAPMGISWCLTDSHLIVTLLPQTLKAYLAQEDGDPSLADDAAVADLLAMESGPCAIAYQDVRSQFVSFYPLLQYGAQVFARQLRREGIDVNTTALPSIGAIAPHLQPTLAALRRVDDGYESYVHTTVPGANVGVAAPVLVALLVPAVQASREAARRMQSTNNLKQIVLALHNFHDVHQAFPAAHNAAADGKPLLSWRVHILPFIEQEALYQQFHLDEPWSSPHNRALIAKMPAIYRSPNSRADPGKTVYLGNAGKDGVFLAPKKNDDAKVSAPSGTRMREIRDGTSNTIVAVEADDVAAVIWTKPGDLEVDYDKPFNQLGAMRPSGFLAAFCDGSVHFIANAVDVETLKGLFTKDGGERVQGF